MTVNANKRPKGGCTEGRSHPLPPAHPPPRCRRRLPGGCWQAVGGRGPRRAGGGSGRGGIWGSRVLLMEIEQPPKKGQWPCI